MNLLLLEISLFMNFFVKIMWLDLFVIWSGSIIGTGVPILTLPVLQALKFDTLIVCLLKNRRNREIKPIVWVFNYFWLNSSAFDFSISECTETEILMILYSSYIFNILVL